MGMDAKWMKLAGELLTEAADTLGRNGCNDWRWPVDWTIDERKAFLAAYHAWNKSPLEDYQYALAKVEKPYGPPDFGVARFLGAHLRNEYKEKLDTY